MRALLTLACSASLLLPATAAGKPPVTCGRITVEGQALVVRAHRTKCSDAIRWVRRYITRGTSPTGFKCRAYGDTVPGHCLSRRSVEDKPYFFATRS